MRRPGVAAADCEADTPLLELWFTVASREDADALSAALVANGCEVHEVWDFAGAGSRPEQPWTVLGRGPRTCDPTVMASIAEAHRGSYHILGGASRWER